MTAEGEKYAQFSVPLGDYNTSDLIEPPDVEFLQSCSGSLNSVLKRRISDRLVSYALSNNYLILGSSEMNSAGWQVYRLNAHSPVKSSQTSKQQQQQQNATLSSRVAVSKLANNTTKSRMRPAMNNNASLSSRASGNVSHPQSVQYSSAPKRLSDVSRKCLLRLRRQTLSASTCTLRAPVRTLLRQRLRHARHRTLLTSYLQTSNQTDNVCDCQLQCLLLRSSSWDFNVFHLDQYSLGRPVLHLALHLFNKHGLVHEFSLDYRALIDTFKTIEDGYHPNIAYHNSVHAADVAQAVDCLMLDTPLGQHMTSFDKMTLLLSAFAHDVDHPGVNAPYLLKTNHFLSKLTAHACSVLENHHWRTTAAIIAQTGLFKHFSKELYTQTIDRIRTLILATDIARHQEYVNQFTEYLDQRRGMQADTKSMSDSEREFLMQVIIKLADICNPTRSWELCKHWSSRICTEFFQQGDMERQLGLPVTPRFDRSTTCVADTQLGFIDYVVRHSFALWHRYASTNLSEQLLDNLEENRKMWEIAKVSQQKALAEEMEAQANGEFHEKENCHPQVKPNVVENHDDVQKPRKKTDKADVRRIGEDELGSPVKLSRKEVNTTQREGQDTVYDETLAKYLNDRRHSMPIHAVIGPIAEDGVKTTPVEIETLRPIAEQRRSSVPHVPVYNLNGAVKRLREQVFGPGGRRIGFRLVFGGGLRNTKWCNKRWNLASSTDDFAIDEDDDNRTGNELENSYLTVQVPIIQIDEVLCSVLQQSESFGSDGPQKATDRESDGSYAPKCNLTTKLSLQCPSTMKTLLNGPLGSLKDYLRNRRHSFPPSANELAQMSARNSLSVVRDCQRSWRKGRPKKSPGAPAANIRRVRTIGRTADLAKNQLPQRPRASLLDPNHATNTNQKATTEPSETSEVSQEIRVDSTLSRRSSGRKFLDVMTFTDSSDTENDAEDDEEGERLCLSASPRHRSHSIEFDSARFVGGTMQYLASIGYDVVITVPNMASGSACA